MLGDLGVRGAARHDEAVRVACAERLIRHLHRDLAANIRGDIASRGQVPRRPAGASPNWSTAAPGSSPKDSYHIDVSHLASVVRMSVLAKDPGRSRWRPTSRNTAAVSRRASSSRACRRSRRIFDDHGVYLRALLGRDVDAAIAHFRAKLGPAGRSADPESPDPAVPAQTLVNLLVRLGRLDEAIEVSSQYLAGLPDAALFCPGIAQLCEHRRPEEAGGDCPRPPRPGELHRGAALARFSREGGRLTERGVAVMDFGGFILFGLLALGLLAGGLLLIPLFIARSSRRWLALETWLVGLAILAVSGHYLLPGVLAGRTSLHRRGGGRQRPCRSPAGCRRARSWGHMGRWHIRPGSGEARRPQGRRDDAGKGQGGITTAPGVSRPGSIARRHSDCGIGFQSSVR